MSDQTPECKNHPSGRMPEIQPRSPQEALAVPSFEDWWATQNITGDAPPVLYLAFKELARAAWQHQQQEIERLNQQLADKFGDGYISKSAAKMIYERTEQLKAAATRSIPVEKVDALVERWRKDAATAHDGGDEAERLLLDECADELSALVRDAGAGPATVSCMDCGLPYSEHGLVAHVHSFATKRLPVGLSGLRDDLLSHPDYLAAKAAVAAADGKEGKSNGS